MSKLQKNIAAKLVAALIQSGKDLPEFAQSMGVGRSSMQGYIKGTQNMRIDTIELISQRMGISPAALLSDPRDLDMSPHWLYATLLFIKDNTDQLIDGLSLFSGQLGDWIGELDNTMREELALFEEEDEDM